MDKVYPSTDEAVADVSDGASIALGGFFHAASPVYLTQALAKQGAKNLTIITQSVGLGNWEVNLLINNQQVRKAICNYPFFRSASRLSPFEMQLRAGKVECEVYPLGTFIEKLRSGGAGIAGFYTPTGVGTLIAEGKECHIFDGREYLLELALKPDFAFIHAYMADRMGNIVFRKTAQNYSPEMAKAGRITIAEVENLVEAGELDPNVIHLPGIYVQRVVKVERPKINVTIEQPPEGTYIDVNSIEMGGD
jgi:3-oxoacid CoA-transferase subunit A